MSPLQTNADRDLRMSPLEREQARVDDLTDSLLEQAVHDTKLRVQRERREGLVKMQIASKDAVVPSHLVEDESQVVDGIVVDRALLKQTEFDPHLPLPVLFTKEADTSVHPQAWWWRGGWELGMTRAMWDAYLSGHWCLRCLAPHRVANPAWCKTCRFSFEGAQRAVDTLFETAELRWQRMQREIPLYGAGALKGLKPMNTRGAA